MRNICKNGKKMCRAETTTAYYGHSKFRKKRSTFLPKHFEIIFEHLLESNLEVSDLQKMKICLKIATILRQLSSFLERFKVKKRLLELRNVRFSFLGIFWDLYKNFRMFWLKFTHFLLSTTTLIRRRKFLNSAFICSQTIIFCTIYLEIIYKIFCFYFLCLSCKYFVDTCKLYLNFFQGFHKIM